VRLLSSLRRSRGPPPIRGFFDPGREEISAEARISPDRARSQLLWGNPGLAPVSRLGGTVSSPLLCYRWVHTDQALATSWSWNGPVIVSAETVRDFQLHPGDLLNLRLPDARSGQLSRVPFHYVGVVNEFPTAPRDSFFVANADYLAASSGSDAVGAFLVDTGGQDTAGKAERIRGRLGPGPSVTDIAQVRGRIGSSLTSVDLAGLTRVELGFALVLAAAAGGLVPALGLGERRRSFAIARARREPEPAAWLLAVAGVALAVLGIVGIAWRAGPEVIRELP
jgi:hypothetical protein